MKRKLLILVTMLIMVFGSVMSVHAVETTDNENIYFNGENVIDSLGNYNSNAVLYYESQGDTNKIVLKASTKFKLCAVYIQGRFSFRYYESVNNPVWTYAPTYEVYKLQKDGKWEFYTSSNGTVSDFACSSYYCNIPVFSSETDAQNYLVNGDYSGCENYQDTSQKDAYKNIEDTYDIPYLQNVKYTENKIDNHNHPFTVTWDTLNNLNNECHIEIRAEVMTKEGLLKSKELTENMYKDYFDNIPYADGQYTSSIEDVVAKIKGTTDLFAYDIRKLYLRVAMYDATNKKFMSGGWVRLITDRDSETTTMLPLTVKVDTGFIDKTTGEFVKDIKTDSSYNTTIDGKTGTQITDNPNYIVGTDENGNLDLITLGKSFLNSVNGLFTYVKDIPSFIGKLVLFLPQAIKGLMGLGILAVIILRILGR